MRKVLLPLVLVALAALAVARLASGVRRYAIAEHSMQPALGAGDWVLARPVAGSLQRGDIVIFGHPRRPAFELIKRVIGLPGERVTISGGAVEIDGRSLDRWAAGSTVPDGSWDLGPDELFVLGDNRALSAADGRELGPIPEGAAGWKLWCRYRPLPISRSL